MSDFVAYKDTDARFRLDIPEGRPSAATVTVKKSDNSDLNTAIEDDDIGSQFDDPDVDTTLDGAASADDTSITVDADDDLLPGYRYVINGGAKISEWVTAKSAATTGDSRAVTLWSPLQLDHADGSTFQSTALYLEIPAESNDDIYDSNRIELTYTVGGNEYRLTWLYDVKLHQWRSALSMVDLMDYYPDLEGMGWETRGGFDSMIARGEQELRDRLMEDYGVDLDDIVMDRRADRAHLACTMYLIQRAFMMRQDSSYIENVNLYKEDMLKAVASLAGSPVWREIGEQDMVADDAEEQMWPPVVRRWGRA